MDGTTLSSAALSARSVLDSASSDAAAAARLAARGENGQAAKAFQGVLARLLVREMRRGLGAGLFGKAAGADTFEAWFDEHIGGVLAERDALGLAGMVKTALGRASQAQPAAPTAQGVQP